MELRSLVSGAGSGSFQCFAQPSMQLGRGQLQYQHVRFFLIDDLIARVAELTRALRADG